MQQTSQGARRDGACILSTVNTISVVGVPSSAASYAAGQDLAPAALRSADLLDRLDLRVTSSQAFAADPADSALARTARHLLREDRRISRR